MNDKLDDRAKRNLVMFIISYFINNLASGIMYDTYVNYMQEIARPIATSFWAFYGYATFISAAILLLVPKIGYKKILFLCGISTATAFFVAVYSNFYVLFYIATLLALTGVQLHYIILAPYVSAYTEKLSDNGIKWYTRTYYIGYVGYFLATYLGGFFVVKMFSLSAGMSYRTAREETKYIADMTGNTYDCYLAGNRQVLMIIGIITLLSIIPILRIKELKEDYIKINDNEEKLTFGEKIKYGTKLLLNRDARIYILYWALISFAMGLFTAYYTVFLNRNLHIDKVTSSLMISISYIAIVIFMLFTPFAVKKLGRVGTIGFTVLTSVPFMIIIGMGGRFGHLTIPVVGVALFIRAGLANLSGPAESSVSMSIVSKNLRPVYTALINFLAGIISIVSGCFTGNWLFIKQSGYEYAYYIAAIIYTIAGIVIMVGLRKYNRRNDEDDIRQET